MSLEKGIYEQVLNNEVKKDISSLTGLTAIKKEMDDESSSILISQYVESVVRKILEDKSNVQDKVEIANKLIAQLSSSYPEYDLDSKIIDTKGEALMEVREKLKANDGVCEAKKELAGCGIPVGLSK